MPFRHSNSLHSPGGALGGEELRASLQKLLTSAKGDPALFLSLVPDREIRAIVLMLRRVASYLGRKRARDAGVSCFIAPDARFRARPRDAR